MRGSSFRLLSLFPSLKFPQQPVHWYKLVLHCLGVLSFYSLFFAAFFSPVCFSNRLLAPGDGFIQYMPNFYAPLTLWTNFLYAGFPSAADPQMQSWYPLKLLYSQFGTWNSFVISAYVLASCFAYGYVYTLTTSSLASLVGGLIYGLSGFMMVHLGHTTIVHGAIWFPLLIWALERLRHRVTSYWFVVASAALVCSALSGHPQIFVYSLSISAAYVAVLGWSTMVGRWRYYSLYVAIVVLSTSLAAIQLLPTRELTLLGLRSEFSFAEFVSFSLPPYQALSLLFPYLFGGYAESFYNLPYFGAWNLAEITGYIGLLPLMMAAVSFITYRRKSIVQFWLVISLLAFLLALGDATPLAKLMYLLPVHNKFRVLPRHFMDMALAISVLSGLGVSVIQQNIIRRELIVRIVLATGVLILLVLGSIFIFQDHLQNMAIKSGVQHIEFWPWYNLAIGVPLTIFFLSSFVFIFWSRKPSSEFRRMLLISVLIIDLSSFGWFYEWKYGSPHKDILLSTTSAKRYSELLHATHQRLLPVNGAYGAITEMPPNMSWLWRVPSASGYGPLILSRISQLLAMSPSGAVADTWTRASDRSLDILAIRYLTLPSPHKSGLLWATDDLSLSLGSGCATLKPEAVTLHLPTPFAATAIGMVTFLGCSKAVPDEAPVLQIAVADTHGTVHRQQVLAGRDTSEWAYDCEDVLPHMQHRRATLFESFLTERQSFKPCEGHKYLTIRPLEGIMNVNSIELQWVGPTGAIGIHKISLLDERHGRSLPLSTVSLAVADGTRWRHVEDIGETVVYENLRAMPRVWMVPEVVTLTPPAVLHAIQTSQLPDGRIYDPTQLALVEEPLTFQAPNREPGTAHVVHIADTRLDVHTISPTPSFLVLSDVYYPGWEVTIDGVAAHLFRTNYVLRGVIVPAGRHVVRFAFRPRSLYLGASISAVAAACLLGMVAIGVWRRVCQAPV